MQDGHVGDDLHAVARRLFPIGRSLTGDGVETYQFTQETWESVGGTGNPAAASPAEQDRRAAMLYAQAGSSPWPVCGQ